MRGCSDGGPTLNAQLCQAQSEVDSHDESTNWSPAKEVDTSLEETRILKAGHAGVALENFSLGPLIEAELISD